MSRAAPARARSVHADVLGSADGTRAVFESEEDILGEGFEPGFNFYARVGE